ncbi:arylalkylamine N-acetyltransferase-like 2 [Drosophila nasuta]|uniref:arylalkylamine N-acetyltransferase-like 2 n=1 Tax=Drosophila nasuta TaxID=42062 RepID=UPI00295EA1B8|nr:arylalkylamine N-acetyltransferase-like 2 [Drosophila nasuta]
MSAIIRELKLEDFEELKTFLRDRYLIDEPLWQPHPDGQLQNMADPKKEEYRRNLISQGTSLVALEDGHIVGVALAGALYPSDVEEHGVESEQMSTDTILSKVVRFLAEVERQAKVFEHYDVPKAIYLNILGVDSSVRRQGLGRRLVAAVMEVGRSKGFPLLVTTCTSLYSARVMNALGMECLYSKAYADYKDEAGNVVLKPQAPHTEACVMAIRL